MVKRFEVVMCVSHGTERPGVIISPDEMNEVLPYVIMAPITTVERAFPCRLGVRLKGKEGQIALDLIRAVPKKILGDKIGVLPKNRGREVLALLQQMFDK